MYTLLQTYVEILLNKVRLFNPLRKSPVQLFYFSHTADSKTTGKAETSSRIVRDYVFGGMQFSRELIYGNFTITYVVIQDRLFFGECNRCFVRWGAVIGRGGIPSAGTRGVRDVRRRSVTLLCVSCS